MDKKMKPFTVEEVTEAADTWANYNGFTGETCGQCGGTANVLAGGSGWFCDCSHYNAQSLSSYQIPHSSPDMGTPRSVITDGHRNSEKLSRLLASAKSREQEAT